MHGSETVDVLIVGAGIMGLALAREIKETEPNAKICVVEKDQKTLSDLRKVKDPTKHIN